MCGEGHWISRLALMAGALSGALLVAALMSGAWLNCEETASAASGGHPHTTFAFRIGLWKVCPDQTDINISANYEHQPSTSCLFVKYNHWGELNFTQFAVWRSLEITPIFVSKMRMSAPFGCAGLLLLAGAMACAIAGHCNQDSNMLVACGLYVLSGISIGGSLLVFASVLSDAYYEGLASPDSASLRYTYGWAFFSATASLALANFAAVLCITAYLQRFKSVEEMVRAMVPGAERRLRQHVSSERLVRSSGGVSGVVPPPAPYCDTPEPVLGDTPRIGTTRPDLCEAGPDRISSQSSDPVVIEVPATTASRTAPPSRFKTLGGARYAEPPRPPAQFYSLPRRPIQPAPFCTKSAV